jgi:pimeloyl-ACP methyl ester carboxylesterase
MIEPLLPHYRVIGICHRPLWPNSRPEEVDSWQVITDDMIRFFDQEGLRQVIGVGHSLGAVATMFAALKQPDLFRSLILIEPVFLPPAFLEMAAANPEGLKNMPLVQGALKRRHRWPNRLAAFDRFRAKAVFKHWSDEALWDYVNFGLHEDKATGEVVLTYSREWEARFYALPPVTVWQAIPQVTHPTLAIRGAESDTLRPEAWQLWQDLQPQATFVEVAAASHMAPMERPLIIAQTILDFLRAHKHAAVRFPPYFNLNL